MVPTEPWNTGPWLADNQSRDLNNEFWLVVYLIRSVPGTHLVELPLYQLHRVLNFRHQHEAKQPIQTLKAKRLEGIHNFREDWERQDLLWCLHVVPSLHGIHIKGRGGVRWEKYLTGQPTNKCPALVHWGERRYRNVLRLIQTLPIINLNEILIIGWQVMVTMVTGW